MRPGRILGVMAVGLGISVAVAGIIGAAAWIAVATGQQHRAEPQP